MALAASSPSGPRYRSSSGSSSSFSSSETSSDADVDSDHGAAATSRSASGFFGVSKKGKRWLARFYHEGKKVYVGTFADPRAAARAYDAKKRELKGDAATNLNFPDQAHTSQDAASELSDADEQGESGGEGEGEGSHDDYAADAMQHSHAALTRVPALGQAVSKATRCEQEASHMPGDEATALVLWGDSSGLAVPDSGAMQRESEGAAPADLGGAMRQVAVVREGPSDLRWRQLQEEQAKDDEAKMQAEVRTRPHRAHLAQNMQSRCVRHFYNVRMTLLPPLSSSCPQLCAQRLQDVRDLCAVDAMAVQDGDAEKAELDLAATEKAERDAALRCQNLGPCCVVLRCAVLYCTVLQRLSTLRHPPGGRRYLATFYQLLQPYAWARCMH